MRTNSFRAISRIHSILPHTHTRACRKIKEKIEPLPADGCSVLEYVVASRDSLMGNYARGVVK